MLTYLVQVTEGLLLVATLSGMLLAFAQERWDAAGRRAVAAACALGWLAAAALAILKATTKLVDSGAWNIRFALAYLVGLVLFLVLLVGPLARRMGKAGQVVQQAGVCLMLLGATGYTAPEPLIYPNTIVLSVKSLISTDFFYRMVGWLGGLVLMYLLALSTYKVLRALGERVQLTVVPVAALVVGLELAGLALRALVTRRIIPTQQVFLKVAVWASNNFVLVGLLLAGLSAACAALLLLRSFRAKEPYDNPAQHRKIRKKWRTRRRWLVVGLACAALSLANVTVVKAYDSQEVELSPSEDFELRDDGCYVPLEQVSDGHLHRFTYTTPNGVGIRFIVIQKPGGSSFGIGLDACDICGETGYYERDDQVVCKLCDVVMNVQTIGFKGGCNPIVIDYEIRDGYIVVPFDTLVEHEAIFTR